MESSAAPVSQNSFADRIAWMHAPVHLNCALLPRFLVRMLEQALHGYLCSLEQVFLTLWDLYVQGKLPLQPQPEPEFWAVGEAGCSSAGLSEPAAAARRSAKRFAVLRQAQALADGPQADAAFEDDAGAMAGCALLGFAQAGVVSARLRVLLASTGSFGRLGGRCSGEIGCGAAEMRRETCAQIVPVS